MFAPTEDAFSAINEEDLNFLRSDEGQEDLVRILTYHVVPAVLPSSIVLESPSYETVLGPSITVTQLDEVVFVGGAVVVAYDALANNGIVHLIDTVLEPPEVSSPPTPANMTSSPTVEPGNSTEPTMMPTMAPINQTNASTIVPTNETEDVPTMAPVNISDSPTIIPVNESDVPTLSPANETESPTVAPSAAPTGVPIPDPTTGPTMSPTVNSSSNEVDPLSPPSRAQFFAVTASSVSLLATLGIWFSLF